MSIRVSWIIGIDEVGRGALAGPVVVCALACPADYNIKKEGQRVGLVPLRDSKKLTAQQREEWARWLRGNKNIRFSLAFASPVTIDKINISAAANRCAWKAVTRVLGFVDPIINWKRKVGAKERRGVRIILDGGLHIKNKDFQKQFNANTLPKADERFPVVSAASILAKVNRDFLMNRLDKKYPGYGFSKNVGYGTRVHINKIKVSGFVPVHRQSFLGGVIGKRDYPL